MCGIAGFVNFDSCRPSSLILRRMTAALWHRGPDDEGGVVTGKCALGSRRLAVIDLSFRGHQPMWDGEKKFCIVFNGEIYNHRELKSQLEEKGYRFFSTSDTEVVLNLYKEYRSGCLNKLRGMFALAIWGVENQELFLARDHFGIKPLHFFRNERVLVFGSEIKSLFLHPEMKKKINAKALSYYFSLGFGCIASPETIFEGVYKLPPGYFARLNGVQLTLKPYWRLRRKELQEISFSEAVRKTRGLLEKSVCSQLVADVPVGVFLSGGLDSSLVASLAQRASHQSLRTFSIGFEDKRFDESQYARQVARYLGTEHFCWKFTAKDLLNVLPEIVEKLDEPLADASLLPTYLLSKFTRKEVTVALSGDGGDELFAGYPTYLAHKLGRYLNYLPRFALDWLMTLVVKVLPVVEDLSILKHAPNLPAEFKLRRFFEGLNRDMSMQYLNFLGPMRTEVKRDLLVDSQEKAVALVRRLLKEVGGWDWLNQLLYLDFKLYLGEDGLVKTDRASSFNSLEVRPPFLDVDLTKFVFSLPASYKLHGVTLKYLLKKAADGYLPPEIINRPKKGFGIPTHLWLKRELRSQLGSLLEEKRLRKQGLFEPVFVKRILKEHFEGKVDHRMVIWNLFVFQLWYNRWWK